jgi:glucose-1-phosphate thymidylyltransferase
MKGLILSGGKGTRLRPITFTQAKQLIPVANKPVLFYGIEALVEAGIREIGIVVGDTKNEIMECVKDGSKWGAKITYIEQEAPLGLAHAVKISESFLGKEPFVMYLGDNILRDGIKPFVQKFLSKKPNSLILLSKIDHPERFGVAELEGGKVIRLIEKPKKPPSDLALVGVYIFDYHIFEAVNSIKPSWRNELEITDAIQFLIDKGYKVMAEVVNGWWKDTGKLEDILGANRLILEKIENKIEGELDNESKITGKVIIQKGSIIKRSSIRGPVIIGSGCEIIDSYIGPFTSIHENVKIVRSEIEHSIILEGCTIKDIGSKIDESLIGRFAKIYKCKKKPVAYRLMIGERSEIGVK